MPKREVFLLYTSFALHVQSYIMRILQALAFVKILMKTERGNALLGIVVIIIVFMIGGVFFWNNYQIEQKKNEEAKKQAEITQTIIEQPVVETTTSTATSTDAMFRFDSGSNGKIIKLTPGQNFEIMLSNPGDGGYKFDRAEYDTSLLHLNNHVHNPPTQNIPGNFGTDAWQFTTLKPGATDITITATRPFDTKDIVTIFKSTVSIK